METARKVCNSTDLKVKLAGSSLLNLTLILSVQASLVVGSIWMPVCVYTHTHTHTPSA